MKISEVLNDVSLLYVETSPFIYYTESRVNYIEKVRVVFNEVHEGRIHLTTSVIALTETLMKPLKDNDSALINRYRVMFYHTQGILLVPINARIAELGADLRARYNLRTPDALHVATAIESGCDAFLTNDRDLLRVTEITVLVLDDLELDTSDGEE